MDIRKKLRRVKKMSGTAVGALKNSVVYRYYEKLDLDDRLVFVDPRNGKELASNMLRMIIGLRKLYGSAYRIVVALQPEAVEKTKKLLNRYGLTDVELCGYRTRKYFKSIFSAKYLLSDVSLSPKYVKKPGQVYLNTWHGTPYKCLGIDNAADSVKLDNVQRNLFMTDYLLFPSEYCMEKITDSYSLKDLYQGTVLLAGYPRNTVFFDPGLEPKIREKYQLDGKRVYLYLPTYRESPTEDSGAIHTARLKKYLDEIEAGLADEEVFIVKLHNLVQKELQAMDFNSYRHIRAFPEDVELYEFLCAADCLVTDYSSVFYDFAISGRKIIRFVYDEEEYFRDRRVYEQPVEFPFPKVTETAELIREMRSEKGYSDEEFRKTYCGYDSADSTERIIRRVFEGKKECRELSIYDAEHEHVLFFAGVLLKNGIISSANNLLRNIDDGRKYYVSYSRKGMLGNKDSDIALMPKREGFFEIEGAPKTTFKEQVARFLHYKRGKNAGWIDRTIQKLYERENVRCFTGTDFCAYIQFSGYESEVTNTFLWAKGKKTIFVHNDMVQEIKTKKNCNPVVLGDAYRGYDHVAVVSRALIPPTSSLSKRSDNICVVHNYQDFDSIAKRGDGEIEFQETTDVWVGSGETVPEFLESHSPVFITIGRFSAEKNHPMMTDAFADFRKTHERAGLIIIGGYGIEYENTLEHARKSPAAEGVVIIRSIKNPMPILKRCDLFVLSSQYEGMPMVFMEAARLGVPAIASATVGSKEFMEDFGGYLTENTRAGVTAGMEAFMRGEVGHLKLDPDEYNRNCIREFEELLS